MLAAPGADGATERDHLLHACEQLGMSPEQLGIEIPEPPEVPEGGEFLWEWFWELTGSRTNNGFTPNPIEWSEIEAWARSTGLPLTPYTSQTLHSMDMSWLTAQAERERKKPRKK